MKRSFIRLLGLAIVSLSLAACGTTDPPPSEGGSSNLSTGECAAE